MDLRRIAVGSARRSLPALAVLLVLLVGSASGVTAQLPVVPPPPPVIRSVSPAEANVRERISVRGRNFVDVRSVSIAGVPVRYRVRSRNRITARAPGYAIRGAITVFTGGGAATSPGSVVVRPTLRISETRSPAGSRVSLSGSGFAPGEIIDLYHGTGWVAAGQADRAGRMPSTPLTVPLQTVPGRSFIRAQGRFTGIPVDVTHVVGLDWPQRGFLPEGNRYNRVELSLGPNVVPTLVLDWIADAIGSSRSSPAVLNGTVFVGADTRALLAIPADCATGGDSCSAKALGVTRGPISSSPAVSGTTVYVGSEDGGLYAFDAACPLEARPCAPRWVGQTGGAIVSSPAVTDGLVIVGSVDGKLYAFPLDCGDGPACQPVWVGRTQGAVRSSPAAQDGVAYVGSEDGALYAFDVACAQGGGTCEPLWLGPTGGAVRSSPAVSNGTVYVGSMNGTVHGFPVGCGTNRAACSAIWKGIADGAVESSPVIAESKLVVGTMSGSVMAFSVACSDKDEGCLPIWTATTGDAVRSSPAIGGPTPWGASVFVGSDDGYIYAYPLTCGPVCQPIWASGTRGPISSSPAVVDGVIYAASEDGTVRAWSLP